MTIFLTDSALLDRYRRGDRDALGAVYRHYVDAVAHLARRGFAIDSAYIRGVDRDAEIELVHETFTKAFAEKARLAYDGTQAFRPYLLRITKNSMAERFRKNARTVIAVADPTAVTADDVAWPKQRAFTKEVVATLGAEEQRIVTLRFHDQRSQDEVAAEVGCTRRRVATVERDVQVAVRKRMQPPGLDCLPSRLLAGRDRPSVIEKEAMLVTVMPRAAWRRLWLAATR
jgi:RNA polymerase sigma factor (sigma-70 family)